MKRLRGFSPWALLGLALFDIAASAEQPWTTKHEEGRCAMRGVCGTSGGFFGPKKGLPCPDNGLAEEPEDNIRAALVEVCGDKWNEGPICCAQDQIDGLKTSLKQADGFIATCPACRTNFYDLFCSFTCSPDQSLFVNVTDMEPGKESGTYVVKELNNLWSDNFGTGMYDSCKDVKFGPANAKAMSFIGGGAKTFTEWFKFLGKKSILGSPIQINFPRSEEGDWQDMKFHDEEIYPCNSTDPLYKCACLDCESSCPEARPLNHHDACHVGLLPCLSFSVILIYSVIIALLVTAITGHIAYRKQLRNKQERMRLLHDSSMSDDEDEDGDYIHQAGMLSRPTRRYWPNTVCDALFSRLGRFCARYPAIVIGTCVVIVGLLSLGWLRFAVETDPVRLWVAPDSAAAQEKAFFDEHFGPFFRAEQAFLVNDTHADGPGPVLSSDTLKWWSTVEERVQSLKSNNSKVTLNDICYNPLGGACVIQSVLRYWDSDGGFSTNSWDDYLADCTENPTDCLPDYGNPLYAKNVLGGYNGSVLEAEAMVTTWVVTNHQPGTEGEAIAMDWERSMKDLMHSVEDEAFERGLRLSFNTEISLEEELNKSTNTDAKIVVVSYVIMFLYASLALGSTTVSVRQILRNPASAVVQSKFMLGIIGIVIVLLSVSASVGLFSAAGVKVTLIIAEVIPFLVLAVGVDNIFLIVHEFERVNASYPETGIEERMSKALGRMGPSILLSATMETVAFALGAAVGMPAVRNFAAYAAGAVLINALLQVTMFVSALALNQRRVEANRVDCLPCVRAARSTNVFEGSSPYAAAEEDSLQRFIRRTYAPALLGKKTKTIITAVFAGLFVAGLALIPYVQLGLDQRIALPSDSYLIGYFNDLANYFQTGPPVYFVTVGTNVTERSNQQALCGRFSTCHEDSMSNILEGERKRPGVSHIADPTASWVDDFFIWLNPNSNPGCCVDPKTGEPCFEGRKPPYNSTLWGMPEGEEYVNYLSLFLESVPGAECPYGGKAPYVDAIVYSEAPPAISASHFRTSHTALRTQADFIESYASARRIADDISRSNNIKVFPYSKHYVFFDQYASIVSLTLKLLGSALAVCFIISALLLGSIRTALVVTVTVLMTLVDIAGAMAVAGVSLNALTLVNLIICVGIAVEFCAHIARAFQFPSSRLLDRSGYATSAPIAAAPAGFRASNHAPKLSVGDGPGAGVGQLRGRDARVWAALSQVGGSVFSGITITKLLGAAVLAFTRSKIFEIYYFRVWLLLVVFAALHALVWLPVALSWFGGPDGYVDPVTDGGLEEDLARRRGRGRGLYTDDEDDEEYDSDEYRD